MKENEGGKLKREDGGGQVKGAGWCWCEMAAHFSNLSNLGQEESGGTKSHSQVYQTKTNKD